ncbi:MAG: riboflavin synthase [Cyanobacteriota bacterium]|nr:riboflavin synthase [Cyanobacteriota bacterium]
MFTGLVRAIGEIGIDSGAVRLRLRPPAATDLGPLSLGDSVAVDGVCLTVARLHGDGFSADVSPETLARSGLAERAAAGQRVNLEPALRLSDRLGGHLVSGHVDGRGLVRGISRAGQAWRLELAWHDPAYGRFICDKASVAVDGISLTVAGCEADGRHFWIAVVPHTWSSTTLADRCVGDGVNLEADLLAKYTERLLRPPMEPSQPAEVSRTWLAEQGWI